MINTKNTNLQMEAHKLNSSIYTLTNGDGKELYCGTEEQCSAFIQGWKKCRDVADKIDTQYLSKNYIKINKISACQIECEKADRLIAKMRENEFCDTIQNASGDIVAYEMLCDVHFDWIEENEDGIFTAEEQQIARELQAEMEKHDICAIICYQ